MKFRNEFGEVDIKLYVSTYHDGGALAVGMFALEEDGEYWPYADLTVRIPMTPLENPKTDACLNTNNLPNVEAFVKEYQLGVPTGVVMNSGYCKYPVYRFDLERLDAFRLKELDDQENGGAEE